MKLSVVIPVYNGADFVQKSYNSIINQQVDDFEIIYVDNNSTDTSVKGIQSLLEKDKRIKLFMQTKQGAAPARNMGIENALGDYIYVFDVDDEIYPDALNKMIAVLDKHPSMEAVFGKMVKSYKGIAQTEKPQDETDNVILKETPYWGLYWFSSLRNVVGPPAFLYRKNVFKKIGSYNELLKNDEDTALDIKLGMTCNVAFLDTYVYLYFKHQNSTIQLTKKKGGMIFYTWKRIIHEHLVFYFNNEVPLEFKEKLFRQMFAIMGKLIYYTKGLKNRIQKREEILNDIKPLTVPFYIKSYLTILVVLPIKPLLKFYVYYLSRWYLNGLFRDELNIKND